MVDQVRTVDWKERIVRVEGAADIVALGEVYEKLSVLFDTNQ